MSADMKYYFPSYGRKNRSQRFVLIFFVLLVIQEKLTANEKRMKLTNMRCKSVSTYFNISQCKLKALRGGITEVTVEIAVLRKPINNATVRGVIRKRGVEIGKPLMDFQIDGCAFHRNKQRNVMANLIYQFIGLEQWSNMNHTCPYNICINSPQTITDHIEKFLSNHQHDLLLKKYPFNGWTMGKFLFLPLGHYTITTFWASYNIVDVVVDVHFELFEK